MNMTKMNEQEGLAPYLRSLRAFQPLSRDEEHDLAVRARDGDAAARQKLVRHNLALVVGVVRGLGRNGVRLDDLLQEGNLGLLRAVEKFDPGAGTRFATYATWWIRAYVWKYLKQARSIVKPRSGTVAQADLSLDAPVGDEEGDASRVDLLEDEGPGPEDATISSRGDHELRQTLGKVRGRIGALGWDIIENRLSRDDPETLAQIGKRWNLSRERVRQVEIQTKRFLRGHLGRGEDAGPERAAA